MNDFVMTHVRSINDTGKKLLSCPRRYLIGLGDECIEWSSFGSVSNRLLPVPRRLTPTE